MRDHDRRVWVPSVLRDAGEDDGEVYVVGVRETRDPESWSLLFMECEDTDGEQEIDLGMETYCLVVDPGQATYYGGVRECEIDGVTLRLLLTDEADGFSRACASRRTSRRAAAERTAGGPVAARR